LRKRLRCLEKKVTILHIAEQLHITPATVSRALNNHPRISVETKQLVNDLAEQLNYRRNRIASSLRSGKSHAIGVIVPSADINFFGSVVNGVQTIANQYGYNVLIYQSNELVEYERKAIEAFLCASVDGIIASVAKQTTNFSHYKEVKNRHIPLVFFDRANDLLDAPSVVIDDFKGGYLATKHLIEQGYKRVAHVRGPSHIKIFNERFAGYKAALKESHFTYDAELVVPGDLTIESGRQAAKQLLQLSNPSDAIFAVEDFTALGVIKELKENCVQIPNEVGVVGFANELFGEHITPSLSTIDQQTVQMGKEAFKLLLSLINENNVTERLKMKIVLDALPVFRQSSQRLKV
jgi:LacI family transcriptional regulator